MDRYIYWDMGYNFEGASWNGLERVVLDNPTILYVAIYGYPSDPSYGLDYWFPPDRFKLTIQFIP